MKHFKKNFKKIIHDFNKQNKEKILKKTQFVQELKMQFDFFHQKEEEKRLRLMINSSKNLCFQPDEFQTLLHRTQLKKTIPVINRINKYNRINQI